MFDQRLKSKGIIRSRNAELLSLKGKKKTPSKRFSKAALRKAIEHDDGVKSDLLSDQTKPSLIELSDWQQPAWMHSYKECNELLRSVEILQGEIAKEQLRKMSAVNEQKHDKVIQQFVQEAAAKLNNCEKKLKEMEAAAKFQADMTPTERKNFTSMLMSMAINVREQARKLRAQQEAQYHREQQLSKVSNRATLSLSPRKSTSETESWLSQEQFEDMESEMLKERDQQINKIVKSIYSLNTIYKDLQGLVIEQGSLLDRIDEHIDKTVESVQEARKHLQKAKQQQNSVCLNRCRRLLVGLIILMAFILLVKHI